MPRQVLEFRVVVASPSDVFETRKVVFEVLHDLNRTFEVQGVAVRGLGWEEYATPGVDVEAQSVINAQVLKEYDILIALFATKLGTPTISSASGTIEEIEHSIANNDSPMGIHRAQVYFREKVDNISNVSIDELRRVFDYREQLKSKGVLYRSFKDDNDLAREVRVNVQRPILDFLQKRRHQILRRDESHNATFVTGESNEIIPKGVSSSTGDIAEDELGLLDHVEKAQDAIEITTASMNRITDLIEEIGAETSKLTAELEKISSPNIPVAVRKAAINDFANFLKSRANDITALATTARQNYDLFASALIAASALEREYSDPEQYNKSLSEFLTQAENTLLTIPTNRSHILGFRTVVENLPRITIQFNQAKKQLIAALNSCLELFDQTERRIFEITAKT